MLYYTQFMRLCKKKERILQQPKNHQALIFAELLSRKDLM